jgi:hypothetical protein
MSFLLFNDAVAGVYETEYTRRDVLLPETRCPDTALTGPAAHRGLLQMETL